MGIWNIGVFISFVIPVNIKGKHVRPIRGSALVHITCAIISSDQISSRLEIRWQFSAFGFVLYLNVKIAKSCVRVRFGRVRAMYERTFRVILHRSFYIYYGQRCEMTQSMWEKHCADVVSLMPTDLINVNCNNCGLRYLNYNIQTNVRIWLSICYFVKGMYCFKFRFKKNPAHTSQKNSVSTSLFCIRVWPNTMS